MSRTSKKEKHLTIEEVLNQALVPDVEQLYRTPHKWSWVYFSSIAKILNGFAFKSKYYTENGIRIIRITNVQDGFIEDKSPVYYPETYRPSIEKFMLHEEDLLISLTGNVGRIGVLSSAFLPAALNQRVGCIRIKSSAIEKRFLFYYLLSDEFQKRCIKNAKGSAQLNMSTEWLNEQPIPIPPYSEQQRIVDRIEGLFAKLDEANEKAQEVIDGFEDRRSAILSKAFSGELTQEWRKNHSFDAQALYQKIQTHLSTIKRKKQKKVHNNQKESLQAKIPKEWLLIDLDSISTQITDGEHKTPNRVQSFCGYYLLSARNVYNDSLRLDDVDYIDSEEYHRISKRCNPQKGDILISCSGSVGRSCVVSDDNKYCMVRSAAMISQKGCNPRFIMYMLQSEPGQKQIKQLSKQTAQANLFLGAIASLVIPLPSKEEQDIVVERLDVILKKLNSAKETAEQVIEQIEVMKKAILARAFRGELATNDPNDEPAIELLKRVLSDESAKENEPKPAKKRITIPKDLSNQLSTAMERKIIKLYFELDTDVLSLDDIFSVSSKKLDILDCIRTLEKKQIIIQEENGKYRLVR